MAKNGVDLEHLETLGYDVVKNQVGRGDYVDPEELKLLNGWLLIKEREIQYLEECENARIAAHLNTNRNARIANAISLLALVISLFAARNDIQTMAKGLFSWVAK